jgi:membrane-associated protein
MEPIALAGLVAILLIKEAGVPIPIPGDLLVIGAGATLSADGAAAVGGLALILLAGYVGGTVQFALMRGAVRRPLLAMLARVGVSRDRLDRLSARLRRGGARGVAVSRMTPGVRVASIAASGLADLPLPAFARGLVAGNTVFVGLHFGLGFGLGASAERVVSAAAASLLPVALAVAGFAVAGALGWYLVQRRRRRPEALSPALAWADAACPACLAVALLARPAEREV